MGKCCSKQEEVIVHESYETHEILLDPGGAFKMTGGTLVARTPETNWGGVTPRGPVSKTPRILPARDINKLRNTCELNVLRNRGLVTERIGAVSGGVSGRWSITDAPDSKKPKILPASEINKGKVAGVSKGTVSKGIISKVSGVNKDSGSKAKVSGINKDSGSKAKVSSVNKAKVSGSVNKDSGFSKVSGVNKGSGGVTSEDVGVAKTYNFSTDGGRGRVALFSGSKVTNAKTPFGVPAGNKRMGKTVKETTTRTYIKDGKNYEEVTEVTTKTDDEGNITKTTKTTTKCTSDPYKTTELRDAIDGAKKGRGRRKSSSSSSSSSDESPTRSKVDKDKDQNKEVPKSSEGSKNRTGFLAKLKGTKSEDGDSSDDEDFAKGVHKVVNQYRSKHGVHTLKFSKEMCRYAKQWARKMADDDKMSHNPDNKYGENVFCLSSNSNKIKVKSNEVVDKWYGEMKDHKFGQEPEGTLLKTGHFTQMVWKDSKEMGVGKARNKDGTKIFVVANFEPQGNWMGQFATQVPPVGGFPKPTSASKISLFSAKTRKASSSSDSESSSDEEDFAEDCLKAHNTYRKKHGAPPLKLNKKISKYAKDWAETIAKKDVMQHRSNNKYGENLYVAWSSNPKHMIKAQEAVESWYSEIKDFTFGREPSTLAAGHFTQVVWIDSKELGVGYARSKSGKLYIVANYDPAGNFVGSFATKVPKPV